MAVTASPTADLPRLGIVLMLTAWLFFSLVDLGAKWLALAGVPAFQLAFMRYAGHFVISVGVIAKGGIEASRFKTDHPWQVISRALLLISATVFNFYALRFLPLTVVSAIMFSSPVIVCFLSVFVLKERVGPWRWAAITLGFLGVLVVVRPFGSAFHPTMLLIVYNATALALYSIMTRKLSGVVAVDTMQFYLGLTGTVVLLPFAIWFWVQPENTWSLIVLIGLGVFGWCGHQLLTNAHRFGTANQLMPFTYSFLIYVAIWGYLFFDTVPGAFTLAGAVLIMTAGLIIWKREKK
ncbi:DMT family transporter [Ruegeria faecimaris]|uniref:Permease of the drug/metabolite transporter (DMT) superfamily n=1 Tax=Ruegeria faecimaris TaxID=686389 RepID=A0A521BRL0_9RHOB|nr:DMT family transporter [Ruegeria faecimaris]SMO49794.1 Permease of the drug/metabolite transporter (DMT) superfamily [Ruegeria faecimaris]